MSSQAIRDPLADHLITAQNAALVLIDYQPSQFGTVRSMDADLLRKNIVSTVKAARAFALPIVHSTVNVASGQQQPTVPELAELLAEPVDLLVDLLVTRSAPDTSPPGALGFYGMPVLLLARSGWPPSVRFAGVTLAVALSAAINLR